MIPSNGITSILEIVKSLFTGISPVVLLLLGVLIAFLILDFIIELIFSRAEAEKDSLDNEKILGTRTLNELKEFKFLARKLGYKLPIGWENNIKRQLYEERFQELTEKYGILPEVQVQEKHNFISWLKHKIKK